MGKFKQMQIDIDDDYIALIEEPKPLENISEKEEELFLDYYKDLTKTYILCEHKAKLAFTRKVLVTYCEHCGKIFDIVKR